MADGAFPVGGRQNADRNRGEVGRTEKGWIFSQEELTTSVVGEDRY